MSNTELHHLLNRAIDGVVLHGESDRLRELVRGLEQRAKKAEQDVTDMAAAAVHLTTLVGKRAKQAEAELLGWKKLLQTSREMTAQHWAAIERVKNLRIIAPADAQGPTWAALDLAIRDALDQPQQCPQCGDAGACNGGPCPLATLDQPQPSTTA